MAVPKRRNSKTRGRKRRTHWKINDNVAVEVCPQTGKVHKRHTAYKVDGILYYKGKILQNNQ